MLGAKIVGATSQDPKVRETAKTMGVVFATAGAIAMAYANLTSGNIIGGITNLAGIFSILSISPNIEAQRQEQVMNALGSLAEGQQVIMKGVEGLWKSQHQLVLGLNKGFDAVEKGQRQTAKGLFQVAQLIEQNHLKQMEALQTIYGQVLENGEWLVNRECMLMGRADSFLRVGNLRSFWTGSRLQRPERTF